MIIAKTVPHSEQRYETIGDWFFDIADNLHIKVSKLPDPRMEYAIILHEYIEAVLCKLRGIPEESVTAFDIAFEIARKEGNTDEPGDDPKAPYYKEHRAATEAEKFFCKEMNLDWEEYEKAINNL